MIGRCDDNRIDRPTLDALLERSGLLRGVETTVRFEASSRFGRKVRFEQIMTSRHGRECREQRRDGDISEVAHASGA